MKLYYCQACKRQIRWDPFANCWVHLPINGAYPRHIPTVLPSLRYGPAEFRMGSVHLVVGVSGEYDDRRHWIVKGFAVLSEAEAFVGVLTRRVARLKKISTALDCAEYSSSRSRRSRFFEDGFYPKPTSLDPNMIWGYPSPEYSIVTIEVINGK